MKIILRTQLIKLYASTKKSIMKLILKLNVIHDKSEMLKKIINLYENTRNKI